MPLARGHMSRDLLSVEPGLALSEVAQRMVAKDVGAVLVTEGKRLVGILTERDVLRAVARGIDESATVADWMTRDPETLEPDESTEHAAVLMIHGGFRHLPVHRDRRDALVRDLMRVVLEDTVRAALSCRPLRHGSGGTVAIPREQDGWDRHATFMDQLVDEGFVLLGGPVGDGALLVIAAETEDAVRERLARDPWKPSGHLRTAAVEPGRSSSANCRSRRAKPSTQNGRLLRMSSDATAADVLELVGRVDRAATQEVSPLACRCGALRRGRAPDPGGPGRARRRLAPSVLVNAHLMWRGTAIELLETSGAEPALIEQVRIVLADRCDAGLVSVSRQFDEPRDRLTGLANRPMLLERVGHALQAAGRYEDSVGLIFVEPNLDHDAPDELVLEVADRLRRVARVSDTVARLAGNDFVICAERLSNDLEAVAIADRALMALHQPYSIGGEETARRRQPPASRSPQAETAPRRCWRTPARHAGRRCRTSRARTPRRPRAGRTRSRRR